MNWAYGVEIHAFVLMNNHFHLMVSTPKLNLSEAMCFFMREITRSLNRETGRINQAFGGPHFRCIVESPIYYLHCYKYIYYNPVKAGLSESCESYPYSSLHFLLGQSKATFSTAYDDTLFASLKQTLEWLNRPVDDQAWSSVELALAKSKFKLAKINYSRGENPLERRRL